MCRSRGAMVALRGGLGVAESAGLGSGPLSLDDREAAEVEAIRSRFPC
ncbi:MAG: hypothetical protein GY937_12080 [bacterium]|nr:hypothetical protein [bacterium]